MGDAGNYHNKIIQIGLSLYTKGLLLCVCVEPYWHSRVSLMAARMAKTGGMQCSTAS